MNEKLKGLLDDHLVDETFPKILWVHVSAVGEGAQEVVNQLADKLRETMTVGLCEDFSQLSTETEAFIVPGLCRDYLYNDINEKVLPELVAAKKSYLIPFEIPMYRTKGALERAKTDLAKIKALYYQLPSLLSQTATVVSVSWKTEEGKTKIGLCKNRMAKLVLPFELTD